MSKKFDHVLQLKITLAGVKPPVWRRIQIPCTYSFWDLHVAIQDAMGWLDYHLHEFRVVIPFVDETFPIGIPNDEPLMGDQPTLPGWQVPVSAIFTLHNRTAKYEYDFGDGWSHKIQLEKIIPLPKDGVFPVCVGGKRACPPEDCGGPWGYERLLEAISDPRHEEHTEMLEWIGGSFDPGAFNKVEITFDDPYERWHVAFRQP